MRSRRALLAIILGLAGVLPATPALAGGSDVMAWLEINNCHYSGKASGVAGNTLTVVHRSATGKLKARHTFDVSTGTFEVACPGPKIRSGDRLEARAGAAKTLIRTFIVPDLTLTTNRGFDRVTGKAPGVATVKVEVTICDVAFFGCPVPLTNDVPVNPWTRKWTFTSDEDLKGGAYVTVRWAKNGDRVSRTQRLAQLIVTPGSARVVGTGPRVGRAEAITLRRGDRFSFADPVTGPDASFTATLKRNGTPVKVRKGDIVTSSIAGDATVTVFPTSLAFTGQIEGTCRKNGTVTVLLKTPQGEVSFGYQPTVDATGHWEVPGSVPAGATIESWCATKAGDAIVRRIIVN